MKPPEFKEKVIHSFDQILPFYRTIAEQSRSLDGDILAFAPLNCAKAVDIGCGYGELPLKLADRCTHVVGYDISPAMVRDAHVHVNASHKGNVKIVEADCDVEPATFADVDYIVCVRSAHYLDLPEFCRRVRATARPGTRLLFVGIAKKWFRSPTACLLAELAFYVLNPHVAIRYFRRYGWRSFIRTHRIKYTMDRDPRWKEHIEPFVFDGTLLSYPMCKKLYLDNLPGCSIERLTTREFIVRWEKP